MGSLVRAVGVARGEGDAASSMRLQGRAARECLRAAGVAADDVSFLIYAGIYRDRNMVEPSVASMLQRRIGANTGLHELPGTFSFDVANGACSALVGLSLVDGFLASGAGRYGLVVAGDVEPAPGHSDGFGYAPAASAVLLERGDDHAAGFVRFGSSLSAQGLGAYDGRLVWPQPGAEPRLQLRVADSYLDECLAAAVPALHGFLADEGLTAGDVDLFIASQSPPGLVARLRDETGLGDRVVDVTATYGDVHTAAAGLALDAALRSGRVTPGARVVFLTVGAGVSAWLALYRVPR